MISQEIIEDVLWNNPLLLLTLKDEKVITHFNNLVPYSSAFEIECDQKKTFDIKRFQDIPDIMAVNCDSYEQRYRIPNGIRGIICLFNITDRLKENSLLNPLSSIHYHVNCQDIYNYSKYLPPVLSDNKEWILSELDTWLENDTASSRGIGAWFRYNDLGTVEFRLGEMTFDYKIILKRIMHCNAMIKRIKDQFFPNTTSKPEFEPLDVNKLLEYYKNTPIITDEKEARLLTLLEKKGEELLKLEAKTKSPEEEIPVVRNRIHKIN